MSCDDHSIAAPKSPSQSHRRIKSTGGSALVEDWNKTQEGKSLPPYGPGARYKSLERNTARPPGLAAGGDPRMVPSLEFQTRKTSLPTPSREVCVASLPPTWPYNP